MKDKDLGLLMDENMTYIIYEPSDSKPVKLVFEELPCPVYPSFRCKHAKSSLEDDLMYKICCSNLNNCDRFELTGGVIDDLIL